MLMSNEETSGLQVPIQKRKRNKARLQEEDQQESAAIIDNEHHHHYHEQAIEIKRMKRKPRIQKIPKETPTIV